MDPLEWLPPDTRALLDVGCNVGELLTDCAVAYPEITLAGVDVNRAAIDKARVFLPTADIRHVSGTELPFPDQAFDCVTCIEVLEHIPAEKRRHALGEIHRVLRPGGSFILRVPHAGAFAWLDSNNLRFRFPRFYRAVLGKGRRDAGYESGSSGVVWHHHFTRAELIDLVGPAWQLDGERTGALVLLPLTDILCWPFYRLRRIDNPVFRLLQRIARWDVGRDYGSASFDILLRFRRL